MKLRFYLRGLGVGMLMTAIIIGLTRGSGESLSDAEIQARAAELGMVDGSSMVLSDLQSGEPGANGTQTVEADPAGTSAEGTSVSENNLSGQAEGAGTSENNLSGQAEASASSGEGGDAVPSSESETVIPNAPEAPTAYGEELDSETVSFTIEEGTTSENVSIALAEAGLVDDAKAFNIYVCSMGYSRRLLEGTHLIPRGASYEEILKIIARVRYTD